jgi:hypothetical protein
LKTTPEHPFRRTADDEPKPSSPCHPLTPPRIVERSQEESGPGAVNIIPFVFAVIPDDPGKHLEFPGYFGNPGA